MFKEKSRVKKEKQTWKSWFIVNAFRVIFSPYVKQFYCRRGAEIVVNIVTRFWAVRLRDRGSITGSAKSFLCSKVCRPSLVAHWPSLFSVYLPGALFPGVKQPLA